MVEWLGKYDVSIFEALKYGWKYSPHYDQLVFLFKDAEGNVSVTQARNFSKEAKRKYFNQGSVGEVLPLFTCSENSTRKVVAVEDAVSAARIARQSDCLACLGSHLPVSKIIALKRLKYSSLVVWLDHDKYREALEIADKAKWLGMSARGIWTEKDPKEYTDEEIKKYLDKSL